MNALRNLRLFLFSVGKQYRDPIERRQAQGVLAVNWIILVGSVVWFGALVGLGVTAITELVVPIIGIALTATVFSSLRQGAIGTASYLLVSLVMAASAFIIVFTDNPIRIIHVMTPIVLAGMLLSSGGIIITGVTMMLVALLDVLRILNIGAYSPQEAVFQAVGLTLIIGASVAIQAIFVGRRRRLAEASVEELANMRRVLEAARDIDVGMAEDNALTAMIRVLREAYSLDSVQVYLMDDEDKLSRLVRAGMRRTEVILLEGDEVLTLGDTHPISDAARFRQAIHVTMDSIPKRREYFMPSVQRGLAIPLVDGERVLGVVDIQSVDSTPFSNSEIELFALVVGSFATLVHLLQSSDVLQRSMREQEMIANRLQTQLAQLQAQRQQMVSNVWGEYIEQRGQDVVGFDIRQNEILRAEDMPPAMVQALQTEEFYVHVENGEKLMSVPILLRGETLGAMSFALPLDHVITDRQIELARTVALRLGSALENVRLLERTQMQALRERKATEVANLLYGATDITSLLKLAADSFNETLGAIQTRIFIEPNTLSAPRYPSQSPSGGTNGHQQNGDGA